MGPWALNEVSEEGSEFFMFFAFFNCSLSLEVDCKGKNVTEEPTRQKKPWCTNTEVYQLFRRALLEALYMLPPLMINRVWEFFTLLLTFK